MRRVLEDAPCVKLGTFGASSRRTLPGWRRELLGEEIRAVLRPGVTEEEIQAKAESLLGLAA